MTAPKSIGDKHGFQPLPITVGSPAHKIGTSLLAPGGYIDVVSMCGAFVDYLHLGFLRTRRPGDTYELCPDCWPFEGDA